MPFSGMLRRVALVPSSPILVTLMIDAINSSETSVLTRATRLNITGDDILLIFVWTRICACVRVFE
jgi:hypothetical protein